MKTLVNDYNADPTIKSKDGQTALQVAKEKEWDDIVEYLNDFEVLV